MSDFRSNLRECVKTMLPFVAGATAAAAAFAYIGGVMFALVWWLDANIIVAYFAALTSAPVPGAFACAAWKTWVKPYLSRVTL